MSRRLPIVLLVASLLVTRTLAQVSPPSPSPITTLDEIVERAPQRDSDLGVLASYTAEVFQLIESGALRNGEEFFRAANLTLWDSTHFRVERVRYELTLAAAVLNDANAEKSLPNIWDQLLSSLGRPSRIDAGGLAREHPEERQLDSAPASIQTVLRNPTAARLAVQGQKNNAEVKKIVDADQAARRRDWSKLTRTERHAIGAEDRLREVRIREIIAAGDLHTSGDFVNASLVMQHSSTFGGYQLAHELAVCSVLLGDRSFGRWLIAATYDRMLCSVGHDQRFGTQFMTRQDGSSFLVRVDKSGICDQQRVTLGCPTIDAARNPPPPRAQTEYDRLSEQSEELQQARNFPEAERVERPLLALARTDKTVSVGRLAGLIIRLAQTLNENGKFTEAEPLARESLALRERNRSSTTWSVFSARATLGRSLLGQKKYSEAEPLLLDAYMGLTEREADIPDVSKVRIRDTAEGLARIYESTERPDKAREWRQKATDFDRNR
ncbi:MAG: tetratricopeptide repeat protein [Verrucomicrobiota bacterium]